MQYNLSSELDRQRFCTRVNYLRSKGAVVELTEKAFKTPNQNRYLHLLIGIVAMGTGNSLEDTKREYFKAMVNPDIFKVYKTDNRGNTITTYRSITEVSKEEISIAIDRFKRWGYENGIYMPNPDDLSLLKEIEIEMGRQKMYL